MKLQDLNIVVIGAGIGGLAAGALLARKGAMVTVLEAQDYPGGCAATFSRNGYCFDAGATIGCGFHTGAPMETLGKELGITWPVVPEAVAWQYRHRALLFDLQPNRLDILERFPHSAPFWAEQNALAKLLWHFSEGGLSWPVKGAYSELKRAYTERVLDVLSAQFPDARNAIRSITAATPVTWERYTGRVQGCVGGYPQTSLFKVRGPLTRFDNMFLVGDSIFPGQSLPGVVTGARRTIELLLQRNAKVGSQQP